MKKTGDIIGLPVIDLSTGKEIGKVWDLIINGEKGTADFFIVDDGMMLLGAKVVAAKDVQGIGEYAVTVGKGDALKEIGKVEQAVELYKKNVRVKGTEVLTHKGRLIGRTGDIYIDENTCTISALEFAFAGKPDRLWMISRDNIVTFGERLVVVVEKIEDALEELPLSEEGEAEELSETVSPAGEDMKAGAEITQTETEEVLPQIQNKDEGSAIPEASTREETLDQKEDGSSEDEEPDSRQAGGKQMEDKEKAEPQKDVNNKRKSKREETKAKADSKQVSPTRNNDEQAGQEDKDAVAGSEEIQGNGAFEEGISARTCSYKQVVKDGAGDRKEEPAKKEDKKQENDKKEAGKQAETKTANVFEQKQKEFLIGRKVTKAIKDKMGNVILDEGETITGEAVDRAKDAGKLIEIVMNNRP